MKVVWSGNAKRNLRRISSFYQDMGASTAGLNLTRLIVQKCSVLGAFPLIGLVVPDLLPSHPPYRRLVVNKHVVYYWIASDKVVIGAVVDGRTDPAGFLSRLP